MFFQTTNLLVIEILFLAVHHVFNLHYTLCIRVGCISLDPNFLDMLSKKLI